MKPATAVRAAALALLLLAPFAARAEDWRAFGQSVCDDQGEGVHVFHYANGEVKASIICAEAGDKDYVQQARYFDRQGRGLLQEENDPADPAKSRYREWVYESDMGPPSQENLFDGAGKLLSTQAVHAATPVPRTPSEGGFRWSRGNYDDYVDLCRAQANAVLTPVTGPLSDHELFTDNACPCLAERALRIDDARDEAGMRSRGLDPGSLRDRLSLAAGRSLTACVCPNAVPGGKLEDFCKVAADVQRRWRAPPD